MDWYQTIFDLIDTRSFSNMWFWIALAVVWSSASHWVLGVPFDMVYRARRKGGQAEADLQDIVRVNASRMLYIADTAGMVILALVCFLLTMLAMLGWVYAIEFAQAVFLLAFPLSLVGALSLFTARRIQANGEQGADLRRSLSRCRIYIQMIGAVSIFVTALWGMYQNISLSILGG
ncbi:MAG: component of SufBCD complex [Paracoccaceae bacterium]